MPRYQHWADALKLREEITDASGQIADLQMSLYSAVYTDRDVPYQDPDYYAQITEPTAGLLRFMGRITRLLGMGTTGKALFTDYLLPFEVTSVLILIAIVGAVDLARKEMD